MSRSYRKTPIFGHVDAREAWWKQAEHQRERHLVQQMLDQGEDVLPDEKKWGNPWSSPKDGKFYWGDVPPKYMRK